MNMHMFQHNITREVHYGSTYCPQVLLTRACIPNHWYKK